MIAPFAVIFDMDGVLVDSYAAHFKSWRQAAARRGLAMTQSQFVETFGRTSPEVIRTLWGAARFDDQQIAALDDEKEADFRQIIAADFPEMPGATALLESLHAAGFAIGLGSSAPLENVEVTLDKLGRRSLFSAIVTRADVHRGKPDPEVFLHAAARMRIPPERCAVVEDSPLGIQAAHAARAAGIGLASTGRTRESLSAADLVVDHLSDLTPDWILDVICKRFGHLQVDSE